MNEIKYLCWDIHKDIYVEKEFGNLLKAARAFLQCKEVEAEEIINKILMESTNEKVKSYGEEILLSIMFWQNRYLEIEKLSLLAEEKKNLVMSIMGFYNNPDYKIIDNGKQATMNMPNIMEGLPAIKARINDCEVNLLFDTGSMVTVLSHKVAKASGISIDSQSNTLEGQNAIGNILNPTPVQVKNIKINNIEIENKMCLVLPNEMLEFGVDEAGDIRQIDGTIGWDIIKDFRWTIDFNKGETSLEISRPIIERKNMCCDFYPMINLLYGNNNMCLGLDTGANNTVFRKSTALELGKLEKSNIEVYSAGGTVQEEGYIIPELDLYINGEVAKIKNATVRESIHDNTNNFILPGIIGSDIAKGKKLLIDFPNRFFSLV